MNLHNYNLVIINTSGGKDSICAIWEVCKLAKKQQFSKSKIHLSHQELGESEWPGVKEIVASQADFFQLQIHYSKRRDINGREETLLEYVKRRGKWPSNKQRYCTSDFKRGPGARIVTKLSSGIKPCKVLYVFGFRKDESPARSKKKKYKLNQRLSNLNRKVFDWLPILNWSTRQVWLTIKKNNIPYHWAYDIGMPRLSCCFCIFAPFDALLIAGKSNPELLDKYVEIEQQIGHSFRHEFSIESVKKALHTGQEPGDITDWVM